jgi:hypothetical protein
MVQLRAEQAKRAELTAEIESLKQEADELKHICPKCRKEFRRGMYIHQKYCKG